jgi:tripartite-type tricarboxylate transporter receptor subunit TctC
MARTRAALGTLQHHSSFIIHRSSFILLCSALVAGSLPAAAQQYPVRPVRLIVAVAPGGGMDTTARGIGAKLSEQLGQTLVADNRGGGGGSIAAEITREAAPDGYTLMIMSATFMIRPLLYEVRYAPRDFAPISQMTAQPYLLVVNTSVPARSVRELVDYAKAHPAQLNFASAGQGSLIHLATELFNARTGVKTTHVPYKGMGAAYPDLIGGRIQFALGSIISAQPHVRAGRLRALGVTSARRAQAMPDVLTVAEAGVPGYEVIQWYGMLAPAKTPRAIVDRLQREIARALQQPDVIKRMAAEGSEAVGSTPREFAAHMKAEGEKWAKVIRDAGIRTQ